MVRNLLNVQVSSFWKYKNMTILEEFHPCKCQEKWKFRKVSITVSAKLRGKSVGLARANVGSGSCERVCSVALFVLFFLSLWSSSYKESCDVRRPLKQSVCKQTGLMSSLTSSPPLSSLENTLRSCNPFIGHLSFQLCDLNLPRVIIQY